MSITLDSINTQPKQLQDWLAGTPENIPNDTKTRKLSTISSAISNSTNASDTRTLISSPPLISQDNSLESLVTTFDNLLPLLNTSEIDLSLPFSANSIKTQSEMLPSANPVSNPSSMNFLKMDNNDNPTAGSLLLKSLFEKMTSIPFKLFIQGICDEYAKEISVDPSTITSLIRKPEDGRVTSDYLDATIFKDFKFTTDNLVDSLYEVHQHMKKIFKKYKLETGDDYYKLAMVYLNGNEDISKEPTKAIQFLKIAANGKAKGFPRNMDAVVQLGLCSLNGTGIEKNHDLAFEAFQTSAKAKDTRGMLYLSRCYLLGIHCKIDITKSVKYLERAAVSNIEAQLDIAQFYDQGINGYTKDHANAFQYYKRGALQGSSLSQYYVGCCYQHGHGVNVNYQLAVEWFEKAAEQGYVLAQNNLGYLLQNGRGLDPSNSKAIHWYQEAVKQNYAPAQNNLAFMYMNGQGVAKDLKRAFNLYTLASGQGHIQAQHHLAHCYQVGQGVEQDIKQAIYWYRQASEAGYGPSQNNLALCYEFGMGVEEDMDTALQLYTTAATNGDLSAQFNLAQFYDFGNQTSVSHLKIAIKWYEVAAQKGHQESFERLSALRTLSHKTLL
ncbi:hypothetical protein BC833DRAFT_575814 [Globomyces pollinis-pini]|nr:hypothetical protein BC833DRAFT_575814 [Globomyces pollinis-pini]